MHCFIIHSETPIGLGIMAYKKSWSKFIRYLPVIQTICSLSCWFVGLIVMVLVGALAWDMHWSISANCSMVEEMVVEKAEARRGARMEKNFAFPYDLGKKRNRAEVLGNRWISWLLPIGSPSDGYWPQLREGSGHLDFSTEQLAQKAHKLSRTLVVQVVQPFTGWRSRWFCCGCCSHWCGILCRFGCRVACSGPPCGEPQFSVQPGEKLLMSKDDGDWIYVHRYESQMEGSGGWIPVSCINRHPAKKYDVPWQRNLQGVWETNAGKLVKINGPLIHVVDSRVSFVLRADEEGDTTTLLGCSLSDCDWNTARWSNGDVWQRQVKSSEESEEKGPKLQEQCSQENGQPLEKAEVCEERKKDI